MDNCTKTIVSIITMDKREAGKKSTNMKKACFKKLSLMHIFKSEL